MKVGILGSGFGLYGYLPAVLAEDSRSVLLPERYRDRLESRDDIWRLASAIEWCADEQAVLARSDALIICQRPEDQVSRAEEVLQHSNIKRLLLEKPIAPTPTDAVRLLQLLENHGMFFMIGYNFRYTQWARDLRAWSAASGPDASLEIRWTFRAHHYAKNLQNWKRRVSSGGGALGFFGTHLIALLAEMGYDAVRASEISSREADEQMTWRATISGTGLPECCINIDTDSTVSTFSIRTKSRSALPMEYVDFNDPFEADWTANKFDRRVQVLKELCRDFLEGNKAFYSWYRQTNDLWQEIERRSVIVRL